MERTYTESELKQWFEFMLEKYQNCTFNFSLISVRDVMLNSDELYNLKKVLDK